MSELFQFLLLHFRWASLKCAKTTEWRDVQIHKWHKPMVMCLPNFCLTYLHVFAKSALPWAACTCNTWWDFSQDGMDANCGIFWEDKAGVPSDLLWFKSDTQAQFGHPILLQQFEVWTQCQAKGPGDPLYKPIVFSGVTRSFFGTIPPLEEKHLHQTPTSGKLFLRNFYDHQLLYLCPADDLPVFLVLWLLEHLCTANGLHRFSINGTYNTVWHIYII